MVRRLSVGAVAKMTGLTVRALQYYDDEGIFEASGRLPNGRRFYDEDTLLGLEQIVFYARMGLSLERTKELVGSAVGEAEVLDRQELLLRERIEGHHALVEAIGICRAIREAGFPPPWHRLARLAVEAGALDLGYWRDYPFDDAAREVLGRRIPTLEAAMALRREWSALVMRAGAYAAAGIPLSHELARSLAAERDGFMRRWVGDDPDLEVAYRNAGRTWDTRGGLTPGKEQEAEDYLASL